MDIKRQLFQHKFIVIALFFVGFQCTVSGQSIYDAYIQGGSSVRGNAKISANNLTSFGYGYIGGLDLYFNESLGANIGGNYGLSSQGLGFQGHVGGLARIGAFESFFPYFNYGVGANFNATTVETSFLTFGELGVHFGGIQLATRVEYFGGELFQSLRFSYGYSLANFW